jgi:oxygen-independent coproporphyrinogen III oxidase
LRKKFGEAAERFGAPIEELVEDGLLIRSGENLRLTKRGRLLSNEVFGKFIGLDRSVVS